MTQPGFKTAVFSSKKYDRKFLLAAARQHPVELEFFPARLDRKTASLTRGYDSVCVFVNDDLCAATISDLAEQGVRLIALRCAGFNNVDLAACAEHSIPVVRVPDYSPHAVAEHTFGLILTLNRKTHKAFNRVREGNFSLDGLIGFDLYQKTIGVVGCGKIGSKVAQIAAGFGMEVLLSDPHPDPLLEDFGRFADLKTIFEQSDIVTLHCPLNDQTFHMIDTDSLDLMKPDAMLVNTSRGGLVNTREVIQRLKSGRIGSLAIDVYEEEADIFFRDRSSTVLKDDVFARLLTFPNVLITGHQAFFTREAMTRIAETTVASLVCFHRGEPLEFQVTAQPSGEAVKS